MKYSIIFRDKYLEAKLSGKPARDDIISYFNELVNQENWRPGLFLLMDETEIDGSDMIVRDIKDIAEICGRYSMEIGPARVAVIVARDLEYGMNRTWDVFVEGKWNAKTKLFRSRDKALEWLLA